MHILYLHQYFCPPDGAGGTRSYEMAKRLVGAGHKVTLVTSSAFFPDSYTLTNTTHLQIDGIDLVILRTPYSNKMSFARRIWAFVSFACRAVSKVLSIKDFDVVIATSTPLTIIIPGYIASRAKAAPLVFEVRDLWPELPIAIGALKHPASIWLARLLERFAYASAARVIALSPGMKEGIMHAGVNENKIEMIPNACDVELFRVGKDRAERFLDEHPHLRGKKIVLYGGTLGKINDISYMAHLAKAMLALDPQVYFLTCGTGAEWDSVRAKAESLGVLNQNFWMVPPIPKKDMPELLAAATVAISLFRNIPEMQHNSANKVFDALAAGKPVCVNYGGWHADLIDSRGAGLTLSPTDHVQAAQELVEFVNNSDGLRRAGEQAAALADSRFNRDRLAGEFRNVLEKTAREAPAAVRRKSRTLRLKRLFDVIVSGVGLITLSPIFLVISFLILKKMGRPIFFSQVRPGLRGRPFRILKFRTMEAAHEESGAMQSDAERLTPLGETLRRTSLDELPELLNVFLGDMSLVGPRPLLMEYLPHYSSEQSRRHNVRPGITGYAQVHGRNALSWEDKFELDVWYVDHLSLNFDCRILWETVGVVLKGSGVSAKGHATMPRFDEIMARREGAEDD